MATTLNITWHGISCFTILTKRGDLESTIVTDPYDPSTGLRPPRSLKADIVTISHDHIAHNNVSAVKPVGDKSYLVIKGPGEYEARGIFIYGMSGPHGEVSPTRKIDSTTLYRFEVGDLSFAHLGDLGTAIMDSHLEFLQEIDILMIPVGRGPTVGPEQAVEIISQLEPKMVIPMHYAIPGLREKRESVEKFLRELSAKGEKLPKIKVSRKDFKEGEIRIVILEPSR